MSPSNLTVLQQLGRLRADRSSSKFHDQLSSILNSEEYKQSVPKLQGNELISLVDYLDGALDGLDPASSGFRKCLRELRTICSTRTILPTSYTLPTSLLVISRQPVAPAGQRDVYEGTLDGSRVCVKRVRMYSKDGLENSTKTLYQEAVVWKHLAHPNIVPFLGITSTPLQLISEWMPSGNLREYIRKRPGADRLELLHDIADGLYYLHSRNVVHGDLKGSNVLVGATGHAQITDFGLATITRDLNSVRSAPDDQGHTARWTAPEILKDQGTYSKEADVFSFAMVTIEVFTGAVPFGNSPPAAAMTAIMADKRPPRPTHPHFTEEMWTLIRRCWKPDPHLRPDITEVLKVLRGSPGGRNTPRNTGDDAEGKYWSGTGRDNHGASRSALDVDGGQGRDQNRNLSRTDGKTLPTPPGELPTATTGPSTTVVHKPSARGSLPKTSVDVGGAATHYEVDAPQPVSTPPLPSSSRRLFGAGGNDSSANSSTTRFTSERERLKKEKEAREFEENFEKEKKQKEFEREREARENFEREKRQIELKRENEEREAREHKGRVEREQRQREFEREKKEKETREKLEKEKRQKELEREKQEREARDKYENERRQREFEREEKEREAERQRKERAARELEKVENEKKQKVLERQKQEKEAREKYEKERRQRELEREEREREAERQRKERAARELEEKLEREKRLRESERQKAEREAREREEEARRDDLERKRREEEAERQKKDREAWELKKFEDEKRQRELEREREEEETKERQKTFERERKQRELEHQKAEKKAREFEEKLERERRQEEFERTEKEKEAELQRKDEEVREVEKGKKRRQLQREKEEQEAQGLEEERQRKELERQNEEKEARRHKRKEKEKGPLPDDGRDDGGNDPQTPHGLGRTSPYKTTVSGGYLQGGQSQNPSRVSLQNQSRTNLHDGSRAGSRLDLSNKGDGTPSRRVSKRDPSGVTAGNTARSTSRRDQQGGNKSRSRLDLDETLHEDHGAALPQRRGARNRAADERGGEREREVQNASENALDRSTAPAWKQLITRPLTTDERISLVTSIFSDRNQAEVVDRISGDDAQTFVDVVDEVLDKLAPHIHKRCSRTLYRICGRQTLLPKSSILPLFYNSTESPLCHGGFADIWQSQYRGREVAVKVLRMYKRNDPARTRRRFCREVVAWKNLRHRNVLPLLGVTMTDDKLVMVSEWMTNGNINEFVKADPGADRVGLLGDVTKGLIYMHGQGIVHGDLKGANILVDNRGHARLADFSLLTIVSDQTTVISSCTEGGTIQWMSPELLDPDRFGLQGSRPTKESDCYALGMVVYEVLSGQTPFAPAKAPVVIWMVLEGQRPGRPQREDGRHFTDTIWEALGLCWKQQPKERANVKVVLHGLEGKPLPLESTSNVDGDADSDLSDATAADSRPRIVYGENGGPVPPQVAAMTYPPGPVVERPGRPPSPQSPDSPKGGWFMKTFCPCL